jgi:hypothetical protein
MMAKKKITSTKVDVKLNSIEDTVEKFVELFKTVGAGVTIRDVQAFLEFKFVEDMGLTISEFVAAGKRRSQAGAEEEAIEGVDIYSYCFLSLRAPVEARVSRTLSYVVRTSFRATVSYLCRDPVDVESTIKMLRKDVMGGILFTIQNSLVSFLQQATSIDQVKTILVESQLADNLEPAVLNFLRDYLSKYWDQLMAKSLSKKEEDTNQ